MAIRGWPFSTPPLGVPFALNTRSPQAVGLVGWWPLIDSLGGGELRDRGGVRAATRSASGTAWAREGMTFSGTGCATYASHTLTAPYTVAYWIETPASIGVGCVVEGIVGNQFGLYFDTTKIYHRGGATVSVTYALAVNSSYVVTVTNNGAGSGNVSFFVNGGTVGTAQTMAGTLPLAVLGNYAASGGGYPLTGKLFEARHYNRALSAAEVFALWAPTTRWNLYGVQVARKGPSGGLIWPGIGMGVIGGGMGIRQAA